MLAQFGPIQFEIQPVNFTETSRETSAGLVDKPVMGRRQPVEFTGDESETLRLTVKLFPFNFGGLDALGHLDAIRKTGVPQVFVRGDGEVLGWFRLATVSERSSYIGPGGVGRQIDVEISLKRDDPPNPATYFASIAGLI